MVYATMPEGVKFEDNISPKIDAFFKQWIVLFYSHGIEPTTAAMKVIAQVKMLELQGVAVTWSVKERMPLVYLKGWFVCFCFKFR
jgi:hypothetical protein